MCESMDFRKITARLLEIPIKKLTGICKNANGVIKQIDSSLATLKDKRQAKTSPIIDVNPEFLRAKKARSSRKRITIQDVLDIKDLKLKIGEDIKAKIGYKLYDWVIEDNLVPDYLSKNYNAIDYLKENNLLINYKNLSANTNKKAVELLRKRIEEHPNSIDWDQLSKNQSAMPLLEVQLSIDRSSSIKIIRWDAFLCNPNPKTITMLKRRLIEEPSYFYDIPWSSLSSNTSDEAIQFLEENYDNIDWKILSDNTNAKAIKLLEAREKIHPDHLDLDSICSNKNAINIINKVFEDSDRRMLIRWATLSRNTNKGAIKLLKWKLERFLDADDDEISWFELSANPSAIEILLDNPDKIVWSRFSDNTKINDQRAIKLLRKKIAEEKGKVKVSGGNYLNWSSLSANPSIFKLM